MAWPPQRPTTSGVLCKLSDIGTTSFLRAMDGSSASVMREGGTRERVTSSRRGESRTDFGQSVFGGGAIRAGRGIGWKWVQQYSFLL
jgi:hypothetical protein